MSRSIFSVLAVSLAVGCTDRYADADFYRPSMTQLRIGEVVVENPPVIPEDRYLPGIVVAPEDFSYEDEANQRRSNDDYALLTDFSAMLELENPDPLEKHVDQYGYTLAASSLVDDHDDMGVDFTDVHQGAIGDCYLAAALTSVVYSDNDYAVRDGMVREVVDDKGMVTHFVVRFYDAWGDPQDIEVDAQLVRRNGKALYARSGDSRSTGEELWPGIVEKAYAKWHGSYEKIGNGGYPGDVMQALTGAQATSRTIEWQSESSLHRAIKDAVDANRPVVAWTRGKNDECDDGNGGTTECADKDGDGVDDYKDTGVYAWHAYSVLDSEQTEDGYRVQLRNPWGSSEPAGNGPDDGIFWMDYGDFYRLYSGIGFGGKYERDVTAPSDVTDLEVVTLGDTIGVTFTTTGDDATSGLAAAYDLRVMRGGDIDDTNFFQAQAIATPDPQSPGTKVTIQLGELEPGDYTVAVRMEDESGNISPLSNVERFTVGEAPPPPTVDDPVFYFEAGEQGWTATGDWTFTGDLFWLGNPATNNYDFGRAAQGRLESPAIDLTPFPAPYIIWDHLLDVESGSEYDYAALVVSEDGFATETTVWEKNTTGDAWTLDYVYLDEFANKTVQFAFVFDSIDTSSNTTTGWQISAVIVDSQ